MKSTTNITSVTRKGVIDKARTVETFGLLDDVTISYVGNHMSDISASTEALPFEGMTGVGRSEIDMAVTYDVSGRIDGDDRRKIESIEYDNDGHPVRIVFWNKNEQRDVWDGLGNHLATEYYNPQSLGGKEPWAIKRYGGDGQIEYQLGPDVGIPNRILLYTPFPGGYFEEGHAYYYISDYQGNNTAVIDSVARIVSETAYYPYGEPWREVFGNPYTFSGNERLLYDGLNEYDFNARRYIGAIPAFSTWDALNEQYPWLSPYAYCAGNPINLVDPDGYRVRPQGDDELEMIRNTLPLDIRDFVVIDKYGFINVDILNSIESDDVNVKALKRLVNDDKTMDVILDDKYDYLDKRGNRENKKMWCDPFVEGESIGKDVEGNTLNGVSTGEEGLLGVTLFPDNDGLQNSTDNHIKVVINKNLSAQGQSEVYSHEANGHGLLYLLSGYNHRAASHHFTGAKDTNRILVNMILKSKQTTIKNMR